MATVYKLCTSVFEKEKSTGNPVLFLRLKGLSFLLFQSTAAGSRRTRCKRPLHPTEVVYHAVQEMSSTIMTVFRPPTVKNFHGRD